MPRRKRAIAGHHVDKHVGAGTIIRLGVTLTIFGPSPANVLDRGGVCVTHEQAAVNRKLGGVTGVMAWAKRAGASDQLRMS